MKITALKGYFCLVYCFYQSYGCNYVSCFTKTCAMPKRILVVDDDPGDQNFFCEALNDIPIKVECSIAINGRDALDAIQTPPPPDIIFLDINMPIMGGFETLLVIKADARYRDIPVIMISTSKHDHDMERSKRLGAAQYIIKPTNFNQWRTELNNILSKFD